jgi:hypothetical protein
MSDMPNVSRIRVVQKRRGVWMNVALYRISIFDTVRPMVSPSDIYVLAGLASHDPPEWTFRAVADRLAVPVPLVQRALERAAGAGLYDPVSKRVHRANLDDFLRHAVRFVAPGALGALEPGVPAAWAAPPMSRLIHEAGDLPPPVWPSADGLVRGRSLDPLHKSAVEATAADTRLAELLSVIDSLRAGDVRIRSVAAQQIRPLLSRDFE